jgi:YbbR domain-containing protein
VSITIPEEVLDVSGAKEDISTTVDITEYLPDGVELVDTSDTTVTVKVRIEAYESRTLYLSESDIAVKGLGRSYELSYALTSIPVTISGLQQDLSRLTAASLNASIDVTGLSEGTHQVTLQTELDEENYAYQPIKVEITIAKKASDEDNVSEEE